MRQSDGWVQGSGADRRLYYPFATYIHTNNIYKALIPKDQSAEKKNRKKRQSIQLEQVRLEELFEGSDCFGFPDVSRECVPK